MSDSEDQPPSVADLLAAGQALEERMRAAQRHLDRATVTGRSADGAVVVLASGGGELRSVRIDPSAITDVAALETAVAEAVRAAAAAAGRMASEWMGEVTIHLY
ncbi:YbaB/EbfC family nucleoid-associated protein [Catenuloplanes japonicus]|uniref:YbaB/EbfC family nucleoid-associated protein n=1 Tax=Catenuloplanes japonicus TaxID=33876 RepID=UPI00068B8F4A|nr:YbaB/EbfC family nucleoid-associated protein [Catenuloplanes japonicus]